jgi:ankyrin repeat protein
MNRTVHFIVATVLVAVALIRPALCGELDKIHTAVVKADLEKVKALLKANPDLVFSTDKHGCTPLFQAAIFGNKKVAEALLSSKAQVNVRNADANTPLLEAAWFGNKDVVVLLLANKAEVNVRNNRGRTPLLLGLTAK